MVPRDWAHHLSSEYLLLPQVLTVFALSAILHLLLPPGLEGLTGACNLMPKDK